MERICCSIILLIFFLLPAEAGQVQTPVTINNLTQMMTYKSPWRVRHPRIVKCAKVGTKVFLAALQIGGEFALWFKH